LNLHPTLSSLASSKAGINKTSYFVKICCSFLLFTQLIACGGGQSNESEVQTQLQTGVFIDSPVSNIAYRTETLSGFTNSEGEYLYHNGEEITFSIGGISFPKVVAKGILTPLDIVGTGDISNVMVSNIARLLQSLDRDRNPVNGIQIDDLAHESAIAMSPSLDSVEFLNEEGVINLLANSGAIETTLVDLKEAQTHLQSSLDDIDSTLSHVEQNKVPIVQAGSDQEVDEQSFVNLIGVGSDSDGTIVSYAWTQISGTTVSLSNVTNQSTSFVAPEVSISEQLIFKLAVTDNDGSTAYGTVNINVYSTNTDTVNSNDNSINTAPSIDSRTFVTEEDNSFQDQLSASDAENNHITYLLIANVSYGSLSLAINGSFSYTPSADFNGEDSFIVQASDGELSSAQMQFTITVNAANDAPTLQAISTITRLDQPITLNLVASDIDGDALSYRIKSPASNGQAVINSDNSVTYTPNSRAIGADSFEVEVSDSQLTANASISLDNNLAFVGNVSTDVDSMDDLDVMLTADGTLLTTKPDYSGQFKFYDLPDGEYFIKVRKPGYRTALARAVMLSSDTLSNSTITDEFTLEALDSNHFSFHWEEDQSTAGYGYAANINEHISIEFLDENITVVDHASANQLHHDFNIILSDSPSASWTQEHAYRLLTIIKTIPQQQRNAYEEQDLAASKWQLTTDALTNDIHIINDGTNKTVLISEDAFVNAAPKMAKVEEKKGVYYSQRLHHALVRFVTNQGTDQSAYEKILTERFGVTTLIPDYPSLTSPTGNEPAGRFQAFHSEEIIHLINMFEEMPTGMHKLSELQYLVRRLNGTPHPLYGEAPAVAWPENGYIEFMESAFTTSSIGHIHRLIIHEKSHFLWAHQFDQQLRDDWIKLGGWYQDANADSGWSTSKQTEFVSAYAHLKNPNEDMAESISFFIINPDLLKSRALGKYEFVRDRIMQGNIYIAQIDEELTFQVYNLFPDYVFPGKIKRLDIDVAGAPTEDKIVTIEVELHTLNTALEGATNAYMRVFSELGAFTDLYLNPVEPINGLSSILQGSFTLSKFAKSGFWHTEQIVITDAVGNQRMEGANDFGWKLYIDNPLEDINPPHYVENSASLSKSVTTIEGQEVQLIHASWGVLEENPMRDNSPCYASMNDDILQTYRVEEYGSYDVVKNLCQIDFIMPHYMASSTYSMNYIEQIDLALNTSGIYFTDPGHGLRDTESIIDEEPQQIILETNNPDIVPPELDLNDIQVSALPTNPGAPNGETEVSINFKVRDNISGYRIAGLRLRDPQGIEHFFWVYNEGTWSLFPEDDPTTWHTYSRTLILPAGSAPGIWGLAEMSIYDRANNFQLYDFTEVIHFDVEDL